MRLLRSTDLALRVLMRLAVAGGSIPTPREVAGGMDVRYTHLAKVVAELQHLGLLAARRGRGGGLHIKRVAQREEPAVTDVGESRHYGRKSSSPAVREAFDPGSAGRSWSATRSKRWCGGMLRCPTASRGTEEKAA
ncbi:Rrf2 family transcriptional regulator [Streptomyces sp. NPDC093598]|uniref:Rrf2 family transcriptional regulator n=1 Tax=Streptomyces sp. NPDC093598 TaxID=3366046 RepID=UPI003809FFEF